MQNPAAHRELQNGEGTIAVDGTWIYYRIEGRGAPCLIMPVTWGLDHLLYTSLLPLLEHQLQLIFVDPRGVGKSGKVRSEGEFSKETLARDVEALRVQLGIEKWIVFGHSGGGFSALRFALMYPLSISHLVLVSTAASGRFFQQAIWQGHHRQNRFIVRARETYRASPSVENFKAFLREIWKQSLYDPEKIVFLDQYLSDADINLERSKHFSNIERNSFDVRDDLTKVTMPTLVIAGREDPQIPPKYSKELARNLPHAQFVMFDESGHYPWIDEPTNFVSVVTSFLNSSR